MTTDLFKPFHEDKAPPWLRSTNGTVYLRGVGDVFDDLLETGKHAVKARLPNTTHATTDAILATGGERLLPRGPSETMAAYATRVRAAWDDWVFSGTPFGILTALANAGYVVSLYTAKGYAYSLSGGALVKTALGFPWTYATAGWNRFHVFFATMPAGWGGTPPAATSDEAKFIIATTKLWKPAHAILDHVFIVVSGITWGGTTWAGSTYSTAAVTATWPVNE